MERIRRLLPSVKQFASPERLLLIDFWSQAEEAQTRDDNVLRQMGDTLNALRKNMKLFRFNCTEDQIWEMPRVLFDGEYDGVVILPPIGRDRGTGDILSALLVRQQLARQSIYDHGKQAGDPSGAAIVNDELLSFWSNASMALVRQRDLGAFVIAVVLATVPDGTSVTILGSNSLLSGGATGRLRETIQRDASLRFVLELGEDWPGIQHYFQLAAITMETGAGLDQLIRLFKVPVEGKVAIDDATRDLQRLGKQQGGSTQYGYVLRNGLPANSSWLVEAHHPRWEQYLNELREVAEVKTLRELGQLHRVMVSPRNRPSDEKTKWPILHPRQITSEGLIDLNEAEEMRYWPQESSEDAVQLRSGDVLIRELQAYAGGTSPLRLGVFPESNQAWHLGYHTLLFRFVDAVEPALRNYVLAYLRSAEVAAWLAAHSTGVHVQHRMLENLPVPIPDHSVLSAYARLRQTRDQFHDWAKQLQSVEERLFGFTALREARRELLEVSARGEQRIAAAKATETLSWRIRNLYPHPLAFRWRTIEIQEPGLEKYLEIFRAAEVCVAYTAIVGCALAECLGKGTALQAITKQAEALRERPGTGVTFWTWVSIVEELNGTRFRDLDPATPFIEVTQLYETNPQLQESINSLMRKRNDMAHDRGPGESELDKAIAAAEAELELLYESVDFLSRYPLRNISYTRRVGRQNRGTYSCQDLVGDHPVPANRNIDYAGETPAEGLHLVDQSGLPHFIEPWLIRRPCSRCHHEETYILDRYMRDGVIMFKSLEYGHELEANDVRDEMAQIGVALPELT